jgi:heptosyltransferase-2
MVRKYLIIRFSSFGDIVQCMGAIAAVKSGEIHWLVRSDLAAIPAANPDIIVWPFDRKEGFFGLLRLGLKLRRQGFTHIYDAHSNIRSRLICFLLKPLPGLGAKLIRRSKERLKRFLLFSLRINYFPSPFKGMHSYLVPLNKWGLGLNEQTKQSWGLPEIQAQWCNKVVLCPSAAWEMKRWPIDAWKKLILALPGVQFVILGGPQDIFCQSIAESAPERVINLAGKISLIESCAIVARASLVISADTGLIHVADLLGIKGILLEGPTAFGRTSGQQIEVLGVELPCRPCTKDGRGNCSQKVWQRCMVEITPDAVAVVAKRLLGPESLCASPITND